jgi:hypothetical protein
MTQFLLRISQFLLSVSVFAENNKVKSKPLELRSRVKIYKKKIIFSKYQLKYI